MVLHQAIANISTLSEKATLFAERMNGAFTPESRVVLLELSDEELDLSVHDLAQKYTPGFEYFLEVFIAQEIIEDWQDNHKGQVLSLEACLESIIYYAENDAYPSSFYSDPLNP